MSSPTKIIVDSAIQAMQERPDDFTADKHFLYDSHANIRYRMSGGDRGLYSPLEHVFGMYHGRRFIKAVEMWKAEWLVRKNNKARDNA